MKKLTARDMVQIAIVAAIYIALTIIPPFNVISFGAYQFRISEMMNFMAFYNRKYIIGVTIGCMIANLFSPLWIDVFVGGGSTLVFLTLGVVLFSKVKPGYLLNGWLRKDFFLFSIFFSISMVTIAIELNIVTGAPFLLTWFTTAIGECASLLVGAILIDKISKRIDLTQ
ncbi:QueT transporter family protein [Streptococcus gordonii]|uniref:QueT transporter family protein n=1 Tax=Streptococcus gordonii TaxID=1302 RepID=UPI000617C293|nr:QueT transporter family protein [Streptococcus gordonii]ALD72168.1 queuosine transporter QueT [Streptococcus gordonii]AOS71793.1 queuosine transporter QueT [Streptococcus gordonii]MCG4822834.1 QueT transporter family protein [Streptococcus gordonii]MCG4848178.1 QueT transporter family protein [Streptococcus gordonii]MCY7146297.1 QueT transporter family protein [Streptococcus gordonii]